MEETPNPPFSGFTPVNDPSQPPTPIKKRTQSSSSTPTPKRKKTDAKPTPSSSSSSSTIPKGGWTQTEDELITTHKKLDKKWGEITSIVNAAEGQGRTENAVRLRYQKVLKDRGVSLSKAEMDVLLQAERDVSGGEKYRYIADRYKELARDEESLEVKELSKGVVQNCLKAYYKKGPQSQE